MGKLDGKVVLITGAASGIGRASAIRMAAEGAAVMCADIDLNGAEVTASRIAQDGSNAAAAMGLDVANEADVQAALQTTVDELGGLDVIFNNAGIGGNEAGWDKTIAVNLSGVYHGLFHGAPFLAARGGGSIINTASVAGLVGLTGIQTGEPAALQPGAGAYVAAKHGVSGLTKQYAVTFGTQGVRVNAIAPGYIETPMTAPVRETEEVQRYIESLHPLGRIGPPEEIAAAAVFLASDDASFITGIVLPVDGGYTAR
ncbi:MAG: SDR family NAD(P)-dependent oxidoreductase [Gammaproteobacteria bacterium]|nr:SDR family NAD(P)-dependent oxidoreductase [Gammaproteobacteria bacterium]